MISFILGLVVGALATYIFKDVLSALIAKVLGKAK